MIDNHLVKLSEEKRDYGKYWSASSAGYCQRKLIFERLGVPPVHPADPRKQRVFTAGHIFHDWIQELTRDAGVSIAQEVELQDEDLLVRGHFDDLVLVPTSPQERGEYVLEKMVQNAEVVPMRDSRLVLYDYKTQNSKAFTWQKGKPMSYFHHMQLGTYMYMLRKVNPQSLYMREVRDKYPDVKLGVPKEYDLLKGLTEARILKISKDDLRMDESQLFWSAQLEKEVVDYWTSLNAHWSASTLPRCTCADRENGFMAKEAFNPYFYDGEPCSLAWYKLWKDIDERKRDDIEQNPPTDQT